MSGGEAPARDAVALWNGKAGSVATATGLRETFERRGVRIVQGDTAEEAASRLRAAVRAGADLVIAAGGDGTVSLAVNALRDHLDAFRLGIVPLGTGNDLRRTLAIPDDPLAALALALDTGVERRRIDLVDVARTGPPLLEVNMAAGGNSTLVIERLDDETKSRWGELAYVRGAADVLTELVTYEGRITIDDETIDGEFFNVIVGNGRCSSGGLQVAPLADPEDGLLDVVIVRDGSFVDMAILAARFAAGVHLGSEQVVHRQGRVVQIATEPAMSFSVDGEILGVGISRFETRARALEVLVGPGYDHALERDASSPTPPESQ